MLAGPSAFAHGTGEGTTPAPQGKCVAFSGVRERLAPLERFDALYGRLEDRLVGARTIHQIVDALDSRKVRQTLLYIQALLKVYEQMPASKADEKLITQIRRDMKSVEDAIGGLQRAEDVLKRSKKAGAPDEYIKALEQEYKEARKTTIQELRASDWLPFPIRHITLLRERLGQYSFEKKKADQQEQVSALIELVKEYRHDLVGMRAHFKPAKFTMDNLEGGLHSARRALRWVSAAIAASHGLYVYDFHSESPEETVRFESLYGNRKYLALAQPMKGAIELPWHDVLTLAMYIVEFGALKDFKESQLDLADVLIKHGLVKTPKEAEEKSFEIMKRRFGDIDVERRARELYEDYLRRDPLKAIKKALERGLESPNQDVDLYRRWLEQESHLPPAKRGSDGGDSKLAPYAVDD